MKATEAKLLSFLHESPQLIIPRLWGNGDVTLILTQVAELPYVMGLVRQSYEQQMGDGGQQ